MMGITKITLVVIISLTASVAAQQAAPGPTPPRISLAEGAALVSLARSAMNTYLAKRTPADDQAVPPRLDRLSQESHPAAVTLRRGGEVVARSIRRGRNLPRSVIAAALQAMRSPRLPDRVTGEVLDALTVELEVLGRPIETGSTEIAGVVTPGLIGLKLSRGGEPSYILPSTAYVLGLDAGQMRRKCMLQLPLRAETAKVAMRWAVFATRHYVGFPDGRIVWLYRGKILTPPEAIDAKALAAAAQAVGRFLLSNQDASGRYALPSSRPDIIEHLYVTIAMAKLARITGQRALASSVNSALGYAVRLVERGEGVARVAGGRPGRQLAASALLAIVIDRMPDGEKGRQLKGELIALLRRAIRDDGMIVAASDERAALPADQLTTALVLAAISSSEAPADDEKTKLAVRVALQPIIADGRTSLDGPTSGLEAAWLGRAAVAATADRRARTLSALLRWIRTHQYKDNAPADQVGAVGDSTSVGPTFATGVCAEMIGRTLAKQGFAAGEQEDQAKRCLKKMRQFCYQMVFKEREVYFAGRADNWLGAVRSSPSSAKVTLTACAGAIEAFLAK